MADISPGRGPPYQPIVQQSPPELTIPELYPFDRSLYFAIISGKTVPRQVVVRGKADGKELVMHVDVESAKFGRKLSEPPFIHTLTAHRLIRDLEIGDMKGKLSEVDQKREIVKLGEYYQLASSHTSFVAVDHGEVRPRQQELQSPPNLSGTVASLFGPFLQYFTYPISLFWSPTVGGRPKQGDKNGLPGGWSTPEGTDSAVPSEQDTDYSDLDAGNDDDDDDDGWATQDSDASFSTLSSLESYSSADLARPGRQPRRSNPSRQQNRALSPQAPYAPPPPTSPANNRSERLKPPPIAPSVANLIQQMSASGSFALTDALGEIVGRDALEEAKSWGDEELVATALAMVYLEKSLGDHLEVYQALVEKGMEFVKNHPNGGAFNEMLDRARTIIQQ